MGGIAVVYIVVISLFFNTEYIDLPNVKEGICLLWQPGIIIGLQILWLIAFLFFGRSTVTTCSLFFNLSHEPQRPAFPLSPEEKTGRFFIDPNLENAPWL
jgi:hypothetical protein